MSTEVKRIYLDTCAWCRPFDYPSNTRIFDESDAVARILRKVDAGEFEIIGGSVLLAEISMITPKFKEDAVTSLVKHIVADFYPVTDNAEKKARQIMKVCGISAMDALHIAIAQDNNAEIFVTTNDIILNKSDCILKYGITIKNPCEV